MKIFHLALSISSIFANDLREDAKTEQRKVSEFMQKQIYGEGDDYKNCSTRCLVGIIVNLPFCQGIGSKVDDNICLLKKFYDLHDCMDSKCPIEKLDQTVKSRPDQTVKQCADESWLAAFKKAAQCSVEDLRTDEMAHLASIRCFYRHFGSVFMDWMNCFNEDLSDKEKAIFEKFHQMTKSKNKDEL